MSSLLNFLKNNEDKPVTTAPAVAPAETAVPVTEGQNQQAVASPVTDAAALKAQIEALQAEVTRLNAAQAQLTAELKADYVTTRDQQRAFTSTLEHRDIEVANKKYLTMMEQLSIMREDFFRLCGGMKERIGSFTAQEVLDSFSAYEVDMENILRDAGVTIGPYETDGNKLNTLHQRIVGVVPTNDPALNGLVAARVADGYEYCGRILLKERVNVFRTTDKTAEEPTANAAVVSAPVSAAAHAAEAPAAASAATVPAAPAREAAATPAAEKKLRRARKGTRSKKNAESAATLTESAACNENKITERDGKDKEE